MISQPQQPPENPAYLVCVKLRKGFITVHLFATGGLISESIIRSENLPPDVWGWDVSPVSLQREKLHL